LGDCFSGKAVTALIDMCLAPSVNGQLRTKKKTSGKTIVEGDMPCVATVELSRIHPRKREIFLRRRVARAMPCVAVALRHESRFCFQKLESIACIAKK